MILLPAEVAAQTFTASDINEPVVVFDRVQDVSPEILARARFYVPEYLGPAAAFAAMATGFGAHSSWSGPARAVKRP